MEKKVEIVTYRIMCWKTKNICLSQRYFLSNFHMLRCPNNSWGHCIIVLNKMVNRKKMMIFISERHKVVICMIKRKTTIENNSLPLFFNVTISVSLKGLLNNNNKKNGIEMDLTFSTLYKR